MCVSCVKAKEEEFSRNSQPKLLKEIQEARKYISLLQEKLGKAAAQVLLERASYTFMYRISNFG